ncbi:potassium-transporting ATPase subunit KdpA [Clostridium sp.]|uniref:potassium-transporting ATPase subunit KdpA n=1 Tax=Clostridium sp. TaxID=1506 RepID=UPI00346400AC
MNILQMVIVIGMFIVLSVVCGRYIYKVIFFKESKLDKFFKYIEGPIYKFLGIDVNEKSTWKKYGVLILISNIVMMGVGYLILRGQNYLIGNPGGVGSLSRDLSINTVVSFMTNTNLQDYAGETALSNLSQMLVITFLMFTSAATGFSVAGAFMRAIARDERGIGNFFVDMTRVIVRILIPFSIVVSILLITQGVPQTLKGAEVINTLENKKQVIALGPVASLEAIKHIGTNGGGFFSGNSSHPFENPTSLSNVIEMLSMMVIPGSFIYALGLGLKNKRQGWTLFIALLLLFIVGLAICYVSESSYGSFGNMEGKELRFGITGSSLFTTITTAFTTGSVNNMHDSLTPLGGMVAMFNMMLNVVFGGKGVGFMGTIMYAIITVFICGLMVGRTPEFLGKKIEAREIKLLSLALLIHPILILIPSALALNIPQGIEGISNGSYHGVSQVVYQFASSAANNGSGFEGLVDNTAFWNLSTAAVMFIGRYLSMIILLAVAASLAKKKTLIETDGTFRTDNGTFGVIFIGVILIVGALTFLPTLVLGPIAEHLSLGL